MRPVTVVDVTISFGRLSSFDLVFHADLECVCEVAPVKPLREKVTSVIVPLSNAPKKIVLFLNTLTLECMLKRNPNKIFDCPATSPFFCFYILKHPRNADE